jgi:hypothetical protein
VKWLDRLPWWLIVVLAVLLGLAPFVPEPHLFEKLRMLRAGTLTRGIDVFDLAWHGMPLVLLAAKLARSGLLSSRRQSRRTQDPGAGRAERP